MYAPRKHPVGMDLQERACYGLVPVDACVAQTSALPMLELGKHPGRHIFGETVAPGIEHADACGPQAFVAGLSGARGKDACPTLASPGLLRPDPYI